MPHIFVWANTDGDATFSLSASEMLNGSNSEHMLQRVSTFLVQNYHTMKHNATMGTFKSEHRTDLKKGIAIPYLVTDTNKSNFDANTESTQNSESCSWDDEIYGLSCTVSSLETTLDLSTRPTVSAVSYWEKIAQDRLELYGLQNRKTAEACFDKGRAYMEIQDYQAAFCDFSVAASIFKAIHGRHHLSVAKCRHYQGIAAYRTNKLGVALKLLQTAFDIRYAILGVHVDTIDTCSHLGAVYFRRNELPDALQCYQKVMGARVEVFGEDQISVAETAIALARIYARMEENQKAERAYKYALKILSGLGEQSKIPQVEKEMYKLRVNKGRLAEF